MKNRPFEGNAHLSGSSVTSLAEWLEANADLTIQLSPDYTIKALVNDLHGIAGGIWSDGIDAMGEDA